MQKNRRKTLKQIAVVATTLGVAGCSNSADSGTAESENGTAEPGNSGSTNQEESDYTVGMYTDLYNDPVGLHIQPGETVSFKLVSGAHSATAYHPDNENALRRRIPEGAEAWDTGVFGDTGTTREVTFETEGTHDYYCIPHKMVGMVGRIVVGEPGGPAEESENPDMKLPDSQRIVDEDKVTWEDWQSNV
ncbi:plastocyanin/azurin family copper-binding protein [Natrinema soli]|uniref:Plastocyanin/azurin family copper-binding protein n=1 Tax=Natrinema soli TaxID=1930624 RepID=A0ABD5SHK8_9EURY|nr:plastocyanin/azurin family copper-binding protein [Natrinema soli]